MKISRKVLLLSSCFSIAVPALAFAGTSTHQKLAAAPSSAVVSTESHVQSQFTSLNSASDHVTMTQQAMVLDVSKSTEKHVAAKPPVHTAAFAAPVKMSTYKVHSGDTLWSIASKFGVSVQQLESWNHLNGHSLLHLGQTLHVVPGAHRTTSTSVHHSTTSSTSSKLSSRSESATGNLATAEFGMQIVQYAERFQGVPYVWGGTSTAGFDCSGFTRFVYGHFGIYLGRTSYDQAGEGSAVSRSNLLPGDLVYFDSYGPGASHVGIYIGGGQFINAASGGVQIDSLYGGYWGAHYLGARRVH